MNDEIPTPFDVESERPLLTFLLFAGGFVGAIAVSALGPWGFA